LEALQVIDISRDAIFTMLKVSLPILLTALSIGLTVSIFQALTQIQEASLSFVPKLIGIFVVLLLTINFIGSSMMSFTENIMSMIVHISDS
jgi:flagellar biosynthetic protein FliQ